MSILDSRGLYKGDPVEHRKRHVYCTVPRGLAAWRRCVAGKLFPRLSTLESGLAGAKSCRVQEKPPLFCGIVAIMM